MLIVRNVHLYNVFGDCVSLIFSESNSLRSFSEVLNTSQCHFNFDCDKLCLLKSVVLKLKLLIAYLCLLL